MSYSRVPTSYNVQDLFAEAGERLTQTSNMPCIGSACFATLE